MGPHREERPKFLSTCWYPNPLLAETKRRQVTYYTLFTDVSHMEKAYPECSSSVRQWVIRKQIKHPCYQCLKLLQVIEMMIYPMMLMLKGSFRETKSHWGKNNKNKNNRFWFQTVTLGVGVQVNCWWLSVKLKCVEMCGKCVQSM